MENKVLHKGDGAPSSSARSSGESSHILREIQFVMRKINENLEKEMSMQDEKRLSKEEIDKHCEDLRYLHSSLEKMNEKMWGKEATRDAEGPSTSKATSDEQTEELQKEAKEKMGGKGGLKEEVTSAYLSGESARLPRLSQGKSLGKSKKLVQGPIDEEEKRKLHSAVEKGDLDTVKGIIGNHAEEQLFLLEGTTALFKAFSCKDYRLASFLVYKGAKLTQFELYELERRPEIVLTCMNNLLSDFSEESEQSCILRMLSFSHSPQNLEGERLNAVKSMYEHLFTSSIIKLLMKLLENQDFDVVYDFESETVSRICGQSDPLDRAFGLTMLNANRIFIGAKNLLSEDSKNTVYGVVAEELCHLAMKSVFDNDGKPYDKYDRELEEKFQEIVCSVESLYHRSPEIESEIKNVFIRYEGPFWHAELIACVPHIIGIYGEESGKEKFKQFPQLERLFDFYKQNVHEKCTHFIDASLNSTSHREMKKLMRKNDFISFQEMQTPPLKKDFKSFRDYVLSKEGISIISTKCVKLCTLHVYYELREKFKEQLKAKCLFFKGEHFVKERREILSVLRSGVCEYLIIVTDRKELNKLTLQDQYINHLTELISKGMKLILIACLQKLEEACMTIDYKWEDLSNQYKKLCLSPMEYIFNGERNLEYCSEEDVLKYFNEEEIMSIMNREPLEAEDGGDVHYQGYNPETYIERKFQVTSFEKEYLRNLPPKTKIFLSGLEKRDLKDLPFDEQLVQWVEGPNDKIKSDKSVIIIHDQTPNSLNGFDYFENWIWLHFDENEFYVRKLNSSGDVFSRALKQKSFNEKDILSLLKRKNVIISDNAGYGNSSVVSSLIDNAKKIDDGWRYWRINCSNFTFDEKDNLSGSHTDEKNKNEENLEPFLNIGLKSGLERLLFKKLVGKKQICLFFDGFDEIPSEHIDNALRILSIARKILALKMLITTRKHHQEELEELLDTYTHQMSPVSEEEQKTYLDKFWKSKLKNPFGERIDLVTREKVINKIRSIRLLSEEGKTVLGKGEELMRAMKTIEAKKDLVSIKKEIDNLNFKGLAERIIEKNSMDKVTIEFLGIPLHLFMVGEIYFNSNFEVYLNSGIYCIYSEFIKRKILVFMEEKGGFTQRGLLRDNVIKMLRDHAYRIHIDLSKDLRNYEKLDDNLKELCEALGIMCIKGEKVEFLHHTFAEFFRAESIRIRLNEEESFADVLFKDKFAVVRRFLENSVQKNNFENISSEFFGLFLQVSKVFVKTFSNLPPRLYKSQLFSAVNILKYLFKAIEETVDSKELDEFATKIEDELKSLRNWFVIGGIISVKMMKLLISRNFKVNSKIIFGVILFNSEWKDVIEILDKCISNFDESKTNEREKRGKILEILNLRKEYEWNLFNYAVLNEKTEVFVKILKYCKEILGNERFIDEIIKSEEYRKAMDIMINNLSLYDVSELMKSLHYVFGNDFSVYFEEIHKIIIIGNSLKIGGEKAFEEAIDLIIEYFGIASLKNTLLSCDSFSDYLIHYFMRFSENAIKNHLNIIKIYLNEKSEMKQFLMFEDLIAKNVFHLAAKKRNVNFCEILPIYSEYFEKEEIAQMLVNCDFEEMNVLHLLIQNHSSEIIIENLNLVKEYLNDEGLFREILRIKDQDSRNILHFAADNENVNFEDILTFCSEYLEKDEIEEMLVSGDDKGWNVMHLLFQRNSSKILIENLNLLKEYLDDEDLFKEILKSKNNHSKNIFHFAVDIINELSISHLNSYLSKNEIKQLLIERGKDGRTCLHCRAGWNSKELLNLLNYSSEIFKDDQIEFEELILAEDHWKRTFLHKFVDSYDINSDKVLEVLKSVKKKVSDKCLKKLLRIRDIRGETFLHIQIRRKKEELIRKLKIVIEKDFIEKLF